MSELRTSDEMRKCEFCGCKTNARQRFCCDKGRDADKARQLTSNERVSDERLAALIKYGAPGGLAPHDFARIVRELQERRAHETSEQPTPAAVLQWAVDSFGPIALNRDERAARLAEEAMEVAQAEGVPLLTLQKIAERIYSRPVGELGQEVGGLGITLYALAANCQLDLFAEINREWKRVLSKPRDWWTRKHAEKVAAGTADLSPRPELKANAGYPEATRPPGGWPKAACPHKHLEGRSLAACVWVEVCDCGKIRYSEKSEPPHD